MKKALLLGLVAAAVTVVAAQEAFSLRVNPAKDEVFKYKNTGTLAVMGMDVKAEFTSKVKVISVSDTELVLESGEVSGTIDAMGQTMEMPDTGSTKTVTNPDGTIKKLEGEGVSPEAYRSANLMVLFRPANPVKVGDEWSHEIGGDKDKGTPPVKISYRVAAVEEVEGMKALKITLSSQEQSGASPASVKGDFWVSTTNGITLKMDVEVKDLPFPGAPEPISGKMGQVIVP